jgi:epoxide hydrolase-like predicted phosphatase
MAAERSPADESTSSPAGASDGAAASGPRAGLLIDWGGVMTTNLMASFSAFCAAEGLDPNALAGAFRAQPQARELLFGFEEGRIEEVEFELGLAELLGVASAEGLIDRLFSGSLLEDAMVDAVRAARAAGVKTGLISNSWGIARYPQELLAELFDGIVLSGQIGIRKPTVRIYELGAESIGLAPRECVFVDDLPFNLPPAQELGMAIVHHTSAQSTIAELERLLGVALGTDGARDPAAG